MHWILRCILFILNLVEVGHFAYVSSAVGAINSILGRFPFAARPEVRGFGMILSIGIS